MIGFQKRHREGRWYQRGRNSVVMTHIPLVRDIVHENANKITGIMGSHSRGPRQPRRRMSVSHEGIPTIWARSASRRKKEKKKKSGPRTPPHAYRSVDSNCCVSILVCFGDDAYVRACVRASMHARVPDWFCETLTGGLRIFTSCDTSYFSLFRNIS